MKKEKNDPYERYLYSDRPPWKPTTLKQKALWVFALIFWLIAACTLFAVKNQELMTPQVTTLSAQNSYSSGSPAELPLDCLQLDSEGGMHLYEIYEGTGWEAGVRVREVQGFSMDEDHVLLDNGGWGEYVQYASKALTDGELVEVIRGGGKAADQWLAVFPEDAPEPDHLPAALRSWPRTATPCCCLWNLTSSPSWKAGPRALCQSFPGPGSTACRLWSSSRAISSARACCS